MEIIVKKTAEIKPHPGNPRKNDAAVEMVAESIRRYGWQQPIVVDRDLVILAGHTRHKAALKLGLAEVPVHVADLTPEQAAAFRIADNRSADIAEWDPEKLLAELGAVGDEDMRFLNLDELLASTKQDAMEEGDPDEVPEEQDEEQSRRGEVYELGPHRLMCGDSTSAEDVHALIGDDPPASLLHADPPYGMNKENEGVENDNLHESKLDSFLMDFWKAWRPKLANNSSAYIWGTAEDLWRLWYVGGLNSIERMTMRNEIVWDKKHGQGMESEKHRMFPTSTERCLFFMIGEQGFNNNADNYWEGWEPIRSYLETEMKKCGWTGKDLNRITGTNMAGHWVTRSQWVFITEDNYKKIQAAARGHDAFKRDHDELKRDHDAFKRDHDELKRDFYATRAFFDNTHENMTDVWEYPRVTGDDRHGHATPKPVAMIARAIKSACPTGGTVLEPFAGSGSTLIACAITGRICRTMEISPRYCDVIRRRWTKFAKENHVEPGTGALE